MSSIEVQIIIIKEMSVRDIPPKSRSLIWDTCREEAVKILVCGAVLISVIAFYAWITETSLGIVDVFNAILTRGITLIPR